MSLNNSSATTSGTSLKGVPLHSSLPNPRFCIICCEETEATQQISEEIARWNLPDVRSLLISADSAQVPINEYRHNLSASQANVVAQSEYAIFITPSTQPCSHLKVNPLDRGCILRTPSLPSSGVLSATSSEKSSSNYPSVLLKALHNCHGRSPQAWWLQLPTTEVRANCTQPISCQKSVAQALHQIGIFVRNYQRNTMLREPVRSENSAADTKKVTDRESATHKTAKAMSAHKEAAHKKIVADKKIATDKEIAADKTTISL